MTGIDDVLALLRAAIGLNPESVGLASIERAVQRRMRQLGVGDAPDYARRVRSSQTELLALVEEVVVPETWFFRDEQPFRYLAQTVVPRFLLAHPRGTFRVLSVPCSTGEEPYSVVMTLLGAGLLPTQFHVEAVDISERALASARRGSFGPNAFRGSLAREAQARHFRRVGDRYRLDPTIVQAVTFSRANVLDATFAPAHVHYEAIFCRNLFIYLEREARVATLRKLGRYLAPAAPIFVGHSESLQLIDPRYRADGVGAFAFVSEPAKRRSARPPPPSRRERAPRPSRRPARLAALAVGDLAPAVARTEPAGAGSNLHRPSARPAEVGGEAALARATELANAGKLDRARRICEEAIGAAPSARAYALLGVIHHAQGDYRLAEEQFTRAVYLDKEHYESLVYLALLCDKRDPEAAAQFRRRAARARGAK